MKEGRKEAFSLAEMMIVLLMVAIVLAATAPMITRKVTRDRSSGKVFEKLNVDPDNAVEYIKGRNQRIYMNARPNGYVGIRETSENIPLNSVLFGYNLLENVTSTSLVGIGFGTKNESESVAIGYKALATGRGATAIGYNTQSTTSYTIAIGHGASTNAKGSTAIGYNAQTLGSNATAIGYNAQASAPNTSSFNSVFGSNNNATAIGYNAIAQKQNSVAIGYNAKATGRNSTAIGNNALAEKSHTVVLGTEEDTVYIPGNLVVNHSALIGRAGRRNDNLYFRPYAEEDGRHFAVLNAGDWKGEDSNITMARNDTDGHFYVEVGPYSTVKEFWRGDYGDNNRTHINYTDPTRGDDPGSRKYSDRRLKNIGEEFTNSLNELNKLKFYHFTFKSDKAKTPHVGVIAQDLQKVFPASVSKDASGYLLIKWDEMFYAAINAIKEINTKVNILTQNIQNITSDLINLKTITEKQQTTIEKQEKIISEQQTELKNLSARIDKLEHKKK